ncbi:MAG TPA: type II toxin-antitoxin system VapC family toxin [Verrucomicrobiae bacterium]|nr:type II toxin-antitoxin system VapC family toxin [Verrucomicrobiae bacterium]
MIADTTFVSDLLKECRRGVPGPALALFAAHRKQKIRTTIITAGEVLLMFEDSPSAWQWLQPWTIYRLHTGIVEAAADIDRFLIRQGKRLGENDNWIAGFSRYYHEPLISRDRGFDAVKGLRRVHY